MYWDQNEVWYISVGGVYKIYSINSLNLKNGLQRTSTEIKIWGLMQNNCWSTIPLRTMGMIRLVVENNGKLLIGWIAIWNWWQLCSWSVAAAAAPGSWSCTGHCGELKHSCCTGRKLFRCIQTFATAAFWWWLSGTHLINTMVMRTTRRMTIMRLNLSWKLSKLSTPNYSTITYYVFISEGGGGHFSVIHTS